MEIRKVSEEEFADLVARDRTSVQRAEEERARVRQVANDLWAQAHREGPLEVSSKTHAEALLLGISLGELRPQGSQLITLHLFGGPPVYYLGKESA